MRRFAMSLTLGAALALASVPTSRVRAAEPTDDQAVLQEIIVTSQRRAERLQDVPVAVTALTAEELDAKGVSSTHDVLPTIPNVTYDESFTIGNSFVSVRGVSQ